MTVDYKKCLSSKIKVSGATLKTPELGKIYSLNQKLPEIALFLPRKA
jgi:hypothetical protein